MASAAAEQQRSAQESELSFIAQLKQARSAQAAASEAARAAALEVQAAEAAAQSAKQGLSKAQTMLQENKAKYYSEQQRCTHLQVACKQLLCSLSWVNLLCFCVKLADPAAGKYACYLRSW